MEEMGAIPLVELIVAQHGNSYLMIGSSQLAQPMMAGNEILRGVWHQERALPGAEFRGISATRAKGAAARHVERAWQLAFDRFAGVAAVPVDLGRRGQQRGRIGVRRPGEQGLGL